MDGAEKHSAGSIEKVILDAYKSLPKNQRKIADFITGSINEAAFLSVVEMGQRCGVSKATVVRFAQNIGFNGFIELKNALQGAVHQKYSILGRLPEVAESDKDTLYKVARQDVENINQTMEAIKLAEFEAIIQRITDSKTIYTYGAGISALMARILAYSLNQVAVRAQSVVSDHLSFEEQLMFMKPDDTLIVFSFPPYSKSTIEAVRLAKDRNIPVLTLTDKSGSPANKYAVNSLTIKSENLLFTNSFAAISVVINAITTEVSVRNKKNTLDFINNINEMMNKGGHFEM